MLIYIHGFGSSGLSFKGDVLKKAFGKNVISPSLSYIPQLAVDTLVQIIQCLQDRGEKVDLLGSSVGGYLSIYLASMYDLKAVLVNPAIYPYRFNEFVGFAEHGFDNSKFQCTKNHIEDLKQYEIQNPNMDKFLLLLQKGDKLLHFKQAQEKFPNSKSIIEEGGSHAFDGFEKKIPKIKEFLD